ncbi:MAG: 7,8-didemethyl-8-hydroxy-5-deazariboflavin synthase [Candidatus Nephthysia bennettiae]|uniref:FO synthase n=1 Tax=Candidatus Nephthysia bennettiae TaxID=3127016 RepID=A0A934N408_9BACT|nr:5-amino-6-(D-ribitylamino)uracil--L-tyrosine 4-hydroxyphenyl transferase CofH [Candidatus Dormibacteraeota bacterium]MBJ7611526.1 5-amino-6-(D-ribitylamino)uracil--L-tyrosine 4-hydroxyphenyl transferase CofH [Candidatus Dormibacteraeota bacterium]PZS00252.1 MAG: 7,8-didemethyl-8-hydroxy-5-deazariboflavin synthase [Candidatus Dormibacteraeota bacterium]
MTDLVRLAATREPEALAWLLSPRQPLDTLLEAAHELRLEGHGHRILFSRNVFLPLTQLCRDNCGYCTFAKPPRPGARAYMQEEEILAMARAAAQAGCQEALFTLGDKPERRYKVARDELREMGFDTTIDYLAHVAGRVLKETGLIPHANPGVMSRDEIAALRRVSASQGLMLEQTSARLLERDQAHWASPDKRPERRLETVRLAGELNVPFTTGFLFGIGETLEERAETIAVVAGLAQQEHVQELIVQNFRAKRGTRMEAAAEPTMEELLRAVAVTRLAAGPAANVQAPPNLAPDDYALLARAGINDWGGVSPLTMDYVNPEAPWPQLRFLEAATRASGSQLAPRLCVYPDYVRDFEAAARWLDPAVLRQVLAATDGEGLQRTAHWWPADQLTPPATYSPSPIRPPVAAALDRAERGERLEEREIETLFTARGEEVGAIAELADAVREEVSGDVITYVITRNINYTNICYYRCQFCAFSKGKMSEDLRGKPELLSIREVVDRCHQAVARGATEVCMQGGIHPSFTGDFYVELLRAIKAELPGLHVHAYSPLEVHQGAETAHRSLAEQLSLLREAGLGTLPGTAAEILDDRIRKYLCPDKIGTQQWAEVVKEAHRQGLRTTSTIMFGSMEGPENWARHLAVLREIQEETGGFTEFVPLPFVHMEAPMFRKGRARRGPTWDEVVKMHAVSRLAFRGLIDNIQVSWVKCGLDGCKLILNSGANDLGGTLMNESISRAAGASHGQEVTPELMRETIRSIGRVPAQRTTTYDILEVFDAVA